MKTPKYEEASGYEGAEAHLEMMLIDEYLQSQGYASIKELCHLPEDEVKKLLIAACRFASLSLAEVESRARFNKEIHYEKT